MFANSQNTHVDGVVSVFRFLLPLSDSACCEDRSIATSYLPRCTLISCVGAIMFRTTTLEKAGFVEPQYFAFGERTICEVVLYCLRTYGPLPAPAELDELNHCSALSVLSASAASVPPCCLTSFELTIPSDVLARIAGRAVLDVFERITTVYLPAGVTVTPSRRNDGLPFRFTSLRSEKATSAEVSGVPSAKCTPLRSWNVNVFASVLAFQDCTNSGTGWATSLPL